MTAPRRGRPPKDPADRRTRRVSVRLSADEYAQIHGAIVRALERGPITSAEAWVRRALLRAARVRPSTTHEGEAP